jgi:ABC-type multidrug transport system ATPase subunit
MSDAPILRAEGFGHRFGERRVLINASLWVYPGETTVVFGRNGCGKSTLLRGITGWLRTDYGVVHFGEHVFERPKLHQLARGGLLYIPERGLLSPLLTVEQHVALFARQFQRSPDRVRAVLGRLHIQGRTGERGSELSPGERLRASFALALLAEPKCLFADEPFLGIAPLDGERIAAALGELRAHGAGVVVTGHETRTLLDIADEVVWMTAGTTHNLGSASAARGHPQFRREYLALA